METQSSTKRRVKHGAAIQGKVTINDVARLARVSKKTVSRVINNSPLVKAETRLRVEAVIAETGYRPDPQARALAMGRSFLIALIYDNPSPQYVVNMQLGILDALVDTGFQLVLRPCDRAEPDFVKKISRFVSEQRPFGVILTPSVSEDEAVAALLADLQCPAVRIASVEFGAPHKSVRTHDAEGAAAAARLLASLGHKAIAHVHGPKSFRSAHERLAGFKDGLRDFGLSLDKRMTIRGGYTFESGFECTLKLLEGEVRPTAIFLGNDEMAVGAYQAVRQAGLRVPEDISIVGFDDTPMASRVWPTMTTVRLPIREMGMAAALLLIEEPDGGHVRRVSFVPEIIVRGSTAKPRG